MSKLLSNCQEDSVEHFFSKTSCSSIFVWLSAETFLRNKRNLLVKTTFYLSSWNLHREFLPWKSQFYNGSKTELRSRSRRETGDYFQAWLSKLNSMCLQEFSGGNFFWYKNNSVTLFVFWQILCQTFDISFLAVFSQQPSRYPEELIEDRVQGIFLGQISFRILSYFIRTLSKKLGNLHWESLEEDFHDNFLQEMKNLPLIFGIWLIFFSNLYEKFSAGLTKLRFAFLAQNVKEWKTFLKEYTFSIVSWFGSNIF